MQARCHTAPIVILCYRALWIAIVLVCTATAVDAQTATDRVRFYMSITFQGDGAVDIDLFRNESPLHVENFLDYIDDAEYSNSFIHRTRSEDQFGNPTAFFAQGGSFKVPTNGVLDSNPIVPRGTVPNEFDPNNGLSNTPGSLGAARTSDPDSATSGWFINVSDNSAGFDPGPFTVFGQVIGGMPLVNLIPFFPNSPALNGTPFESTPFFGGALISIVLADRVSLIDGDYNLDGTVNQADYTAWQQIVGTNIFSPGFVAAVDGNRDGVIDAADYTVWRDNLGQSAASGTVLLPEPGASLLMCIAAAAVAYGRLRARRW